MRKQVLGDAIFCMLVPVRRQVLGLELARVR